MTIADYSQYTGSSHTTQNRYNVDLNYDNRGNILGVERYGATNAGGTSFWNNR